MTYSIILVPSRVPIEWALSWILREAKRLCIHIGISTQIFQIRRYSDLILSRQLEMTPNRVYYILRALYRTNAKFQSHLNFTTACLDRDLIPKGLTIKKTLVVAGAGDVNRLLSIWQRTLRKTSRILLKHLKHYYRTTLLAISRKIHLEETKLKGRTDFRDNWKTIDQYMERITNGTMQERKRKKIKQLDKTSKYKRTRR